MERDLIYSFNQALKEKFTSKKEMAFTIAELLDIEVDSAYRRLNGKVEYKFREIGILANYLNISLDSIMSESAGLRPVHLQLWFEHAPVDNNFLSSLLKEYTLLHRRLDSGALMGYVCESIPLEILSNYRHLMKFMYFKWGHYRVGTKEYDDFNRWSIPDKIIEYHKELAGYIKRYRKILYIWNNSTLFNFVKEINHHIEIGTVTPASAIEIRADLIMFLENLHGVLAGKIRNDYKMDFYVTNFNVGMSVYFVRSGDVYVSGIRTPLVYSIIHDDFETGHKIHQWMESIKNFSYLISGSGEKQRVEFLNEQYNYLDNIKCHG